MAELSIAIADDNRQTLNLLGEILEKEDGIHVVGKADNGEDAYNMIVRTNPDIVLMDVIMPRLDGISVMEKVKNNSSRTSPPPKQQTDFFQFARAETENMTKASRFNTARNYRTAIARLHQYVSFTPLPFHSITPLFIDNFEKYLQNQGCNLNTISCYLRTLRAIYNKAVELELTPQQSPFIRAFTGYENTRKRGIPKLLVTKSRFCSPTFRTSPIPM